MWIVAPTSISRYYKLLNFTFLGMNTSVRTGWSTVGQILKACTHIDVYFSRMKEPTRNGNVSSCIHSCFLQIYFKTYISNPRMSSSSVSTNGFLVPRSQLQWRSHRSMKGYVYYYFDVTSLASWLIHLSPSGKGSGHCRKGVLPVVDEHLPAKAYLTPYHTRYTRTFVLRVDVPTSSVSPQTASMINDSVKTISPNTYLGLSIVEQASLDKLGYELGYGCLDHIFEKLSWLCLVSPLMPYSTWHNQTLPYKLRSTSAAPISQCSTRGQSSAFWL